MNLYMYFLCFGNTLYIKTMCKMHVQNRKSIEIMINFQEKFLFWRGRQENRFFSVVVKKQINLFPGKQEWYYDIKGKGNSGNK